ncbi:DUF86 domain-containing protein [bacterium]|nr:DUF86 domain-containing protein [bacterium]
MSRKDDLAYVKDILTACERIRLILSEDSSPEVMRRISVQDSLVHNIQIVGEAANQLSDSFKARVSMIDWQAMIGMRHRIVHNYFDIDLDIVWDTVLHDLPQLEAALKPWLPEIE